MAPKYFRKKSQSSEYTNFSTSSAIYLVIVESPSKCAKIEGFLGSDYKCIASKGHIRYIDGMSNIDSKNGYAIKFSIVDEKKDHIKFMKSCISHFSKSNIILATDDDREGEAIAWHICDTFDLPVDTTKRIVFHEITKTAVQKAIKNPGVINMNLVLSQHARQVLDMIVGFKVSPFLWKHIHNSKTNGLSAGRCQTPALRLVYDNEQLIRDGGEPETKYKTTGYFFAKQIPFVLNHDFIEKSKLCKFLESSKTFEHKLAIDSPKDSIRQPPRPFNTSNLLQHASNVLNMSPKETMNHCQTLYQAGYITYMRTDSTKYSADFLLKAKNYILEKWNSDEYLGDFSVIENRNNANPHEAIRVTHIETSFVSGIEPRAMSLYKVIWKNTVESCMAAAKYKCTKVSISAPEKHSYTKIVEIPVFLGWKIVCGDEEKEIDVNGIQNSGQGLLLYFQTWNASSPIPFTKIESIVSITNKHSHYTESSLIKKLEDLGIGRPSTFAMIIDTIIERGYVKKTDLPGVNIKCEEFTLRDNVLEKKQSEKTFGKEKNKLVIQPLGIVALEFLTEHFETLFNYDYTKNMEDDLDKISSGESNGKWSDICEKCSTTIKLLSKPVSKMEKPRYFVASEDGRQYELVFHRYGASLKYTAEEEGAEPEYKQVNPKIKIDIELLKEGKYLAEDLIEIKNDYLGKYEDQDMFIKNGKYGPYVKWGDKTCSIKTIKKPLNEIVLKDVIELLQPEPVDPNAPRLPPQLQDKNPNILKPLTAELSIRKGKFGPYVFYMAPNAKKPEFFKLGKYKTTYMNTENEKLIEWIEQTYLSNKIA
jgi:DNA topoisomerase-1